MVLDPIPQSLPVYFFGSRPQPPTSRVMCDEACDNSVHKYMHEHTCMCMNMCVETCRSSRHASYVAYGCVRCVMNAWYVSAHMCIHTHVCSYICTWTEMSRVMMLIRVKHHITMFMHVTRHITRVIRGMQTCMLCDRMCDISLPVSCAICRVKFVSTNTCMNARTSRLLAPHMMCDIMRDICPHASCVIWRVIFPCAYTCMSIRVYVWTLSGEMSHFTSHIARGMRMCMLCDRMCDISLRVCCVIWRVTFASTDTCMSARTSRLLAPHVYDLWHVSTCIMCDRTCVISVRIYVFICTYICIYMYERTHDMMRDMSPQYHMWSMTCDISMQKSYICRNVSAYICIMCDISAYTWFCICVYDVWYFCTHVYVWTHALLASSCHICMSHVTPTNESCRT